MDHHTADVARCLATIGRFLPLAKDAVASRCWNSAAVAARKVLLARRTLDRDVTEHDLFRQVRGGDYLAAVDAAAEAKVILRCALEAGAVRQPRDEELLRDEWTP